MGQSVLWFVLAVFLVTVNAEDVVEDAGGDAGDIYEVRRQVNIVQILRRHLPRKELGDVSLQDISGLQQREAAMLSEVDGILQSLTLPDKGHCEITGTFSGRCCFNFSRSAENFHIDGCLNFQYLEKNSTIDIAMSINGYQIVHFVLNMKSPSPVCLNLKVGKFCAVFHDITFQKGFHGCVDLVISILGREKKLATWCW